MRVNEDTNQDEDITVYSSLSVKGLAENNGNADCVGRLSDGMLSSNAEETKILEIDKDCMQILFLNSKIIKRKEQNNQPTYFSSSHSVATASPVKASKH